MKTHGPQPYETLAGCGVPCVHTAENSWLVAETLEGPAPAYDAHPGPATGKPDYYGLTYHRHMESVTNFPERAIDNLHASGVDIVMSPQLSSDVPAGYLSWAGGLPAQCPLQKCMLHSVKARATWAWGCQSCRFCSPSAELQTCECDLRQTPAAQRSRRQQALMLCIACYQGTGICLRVC